MRSKGKNIFIYSKVTDKLMNLSRNDMAPNIIDIK